MAYAFLFENETDCAKMLVDFATSSKKLEVKGGIFAGKAMTGNQVIAFSKLPSREGLDRSSHWRDRCPTFQPRWCCRSLVRGSDSCYWCRRR